MIQCGPVLANATQVKVKTEPGGPSPPASLPQTKPDGQLEKHYGHKLANKEDPQTDESFGKRNLVPKSDRQSDKSVDKEEDKSSEKQSKRTDKTSSKGTKSESRPAHVTPEKEKASQNHTQDNKNKGKVDHWNFKNISMSNAILHLQLIMQS